MEEVSVLPVPVRQALIIEQGPFQKRRKTQTHLYRYPKASWTQIERRIRMNEILMTSRLSIQNSPKEEEDTTPLKRAEEPQAQVVALCLGTYNSPPGFIRILSLERRLVSSNHTSDRSPNKLLLSIHIPTRFATHYTTDFSSIYFNSFVQRYRILSFNKSMTHLDISAFRVKVIGTFLFVLPV